jgi:TniQ
VGTEAWIDQEQAIWNVLPLHPQPQPLESLTSYMTRLAEVNGFQSINELGALAGGLRMTTLQWRADYPAAAYQGLAQLACYPQERWINMTFFHLVQHFGRATNPSAVHSFLVGSIAASLRYCPLCLAEHYPAYYSLLWRFLVLPGCLEHEVYFLDRCGHCGSSLPLLSHRPRLATCLSCRGDLRTSKALPFSHRDKAWNVLWTHDLQWLLTSEPRSTRWMQARFLGERFQLLRRQRGLSIPETARRLGRETLHVRAMDSLSKTGQARFRDYLRYADLLGYALRQVFYLFV